MNGNVFKVTDIKSDKIAFESVKENFKSYTINIYIVPIPLTEEWLVKAGAKKIHEVLDIFELDRFELYPFYTHGFWKVVDKETKTYITKASYVHELQNMYFALNGEELQL